ncbi:hypothetical protein ACFY1B_10130 [Streptomyces mirabilis]|uniref:hypothetical protein n=1 Tax=Streptomyces mirabilis TaxID=68239 RepID=UPI00368CDBE9
MRVVGLRHQTQGLAWSQISLSCRRLVVRHTSEVRHVETGSLKPPVGWTDKQARSVLTQAKAALVFDEVEKMQASGRRHEAIRGPL